MGTSIRQRKEGKRGGKIRKTSIIREEKRIAREGRIRNY